MTARWTTDEQERVHILSIKSLWNPIIRRGNYIFKINRNTGEDLIGVFLNSYFEVDYESKQIRSEIYVFLHTNNSIAIDLLDIDNIEDATTEANIEFFSSLKPLEDG